MGGRRIALSAPPGTCSTSASTGCGRNNSSPPPASPWPHSPRCEHRCGAQDGARFHRRRRRSSKRRPSATMARASARSPPSRTPGSIESTVPCVLERFIPFAREISVIVARGIDGADRDLPGLRKHPPQSHPRSHHRPGAGQPRRRGIRRARWPARWRRSSI